MTFLDDAGLVKLWQHIQARLSNKIDKVAGKGLSSNDFTDEDKEKLASLKESVQSDWNVNDENDSTYVKNRPFYDTRTETPLLVDYSFTIAEGEKYHKINPAPFIPDASEEEVDGVLVYTRYSVVYDTTTYNLQAKRMSVVSSTTSEEFILLSTSGCEIRYYDDTDFRIYGLPGNHKISVSIVEEGKLSQIQEKFIPRTIARSEYVKQLVGTTRVSEQINEAAIRNRSDWNVNDSSDITYIKNRPFYDTREEKMVMTDYSFTIAEGEDYHSATETFSISKGVKYSIIQNGVYSEKVNGLSYDPFGYRCFRYSGFEFQDHFGIGELRIFAAPGTYTLSVMEYKGEFLQIEDKFIPDTIARNDHTQAASTITSGIFGGTVLANRNSQAPNSFLLRNSRLVATETTPTVNGEICWLYE